MITKSILIGAAMMLAANAGQTAPCDPGHRMSLSQINAAVIGNYTCVGAFPNATWNELLIGGTVVDYKLGPTSTTDKSTQVGTYATGGSDDNLNGGTLVYNYSPGGTFAYFIDTGTSNGTLGSSPFTFCQEIGSITNGTNYLVNVRPNHC